MLQIPGLIRTTHSREDEQNIGGELQAQISRVRRDDAKKRESGSFSNGGFQKV